MLRFRIAAIGRFSIPRCGKAVIVQYTCTLHMHVAHFDLSIRIAGTSIFQNTLNIGASSMGAINRLSLR